MCVVAIAIAAGYIGWSRSTRDASAEPVVERTAGASVDRTKYPYLVFRDTGLGSSHGRVAFAALGAATSAHEPTELSCERVHFAAGHGVCLTADRGFVTTYGAFVFGDDLKARHPFPLPGVPSRVRVSPDGSRAGITVFVSGDSYAPGSFSTRTFVIETTNGTPLGEVEHYTVLRDGKPFKAIDFNFWGITFRDRNRFYATLGTGGNTFLIEGDVEKKQARVIHSNVECPAISPDFTRVAFKRQHTTGGRLMWRLHVLDLKTGRETPLAEERSVDDQAEWLDDQTVIYGMPSDKKPGSTDIWRVPADGHGAATPLLEGAWSPAVVRAGA